MFKFLRKLAFWKKKGQEEKITEDKSPQSETAAQSTTENAEQSQVPIKSVAQPPAAKQQGEPVKEEKTCPKCGAPNDKFVHVCWLCKTEI